MEDITVYVAIDIEKGGDHFLKHPILAIGVCLGKEDIGVIEKKTWCLKPSCNQKMEKRCLDEFWANNLELLGRITLNQVPMEEGLKDFNMWLCNLSFKYSKVVILSDNPAYDIANLDAVLTCGFNVRKQPLRYLGDGKYRSIKDPSEMLNGAGPRAKAAAKKYARQHCVPDHWPENDAEDIYWRYIFALNAAMRIDDSKLEF